MTDIDLDTCLRLVSDRQRRCVLQHVRDRRTETVAVDELVSVVERATADDTPLTAREKERISIQLSHTHLPKFAAHDVIDYDRGDGTVRYQPDERIESLLDSLSEETSLPTL